MLLKPLSFSMKFYGKPLSKQYALFTWGGIKSPSPNAKVIESLNQTIT
jgi:hypothetical protein